jgi:hypothetical protein
LRPGAAHATNRKVTTGTGDGAAVAGAKDFASQWRELRADGEIQFAPLKQPAPDKPPQWWLDFLEWLGRALRPVGDFFGAVARAIGVSSQVLLWVALGIAALFVGWMLWRFFQQLELKRRAKDEAPEEWAPDQGEALALLEDADRLAAEGRFDEATHLLLRRSVGQIAAARPGLLEPSSTAREIAELPALSDTVRSAFGTIAGRVERSLFALRSLSLDDWQAARAAYADFALAARHIAA